MKTIPLFKIITAIAISAVSLHSAFGATYDFEDPKGVNNITFTLDAPLEYISGSANGISGTIEFDLDKPSATSGTIVLETESLMVPNSMMRDHLHGENWLQVKKYPTITFEAKSVSVDSQDGNTVQTTVTGDLTVMETTRTLEVPVTFTYLPGKLSARSNGNMEGDLLVVRSKFSISRSEFGINAGAYEDKVSDDIELQMSIAGANPK